MPLENQKGATLPPAGCEMASQKIVQAWPFFLSRGAG
jgi:hypothetical protein